MEIFDIRLLNSNGVVHWFLAKEKYLVRIDSETSEAVCTCFGDTFRQGGRKQKECKHIKKSRRLLKVLNFDKKFQK